MQKYFELTSALEYIEDHMLDNCSQADIAHAACVSLGLRCRKCSALPSDTASMNIL